eukprot:2813381-Pyramimonas_sp.AAC.1
MARSSRSPGSNSGRAAARTCRGPPRLAPRAPGALAVGRSREHQSYCFKPSWRGRSVALRCL